MDHEFLDLIKTFEKTVKRLETLDSTILNFKDVIEGLRQNLDELVEMVQLEEIVELSEKGSQKIKRLNENLDELSETYQGLLSVDDLNKTYGERLSLLEQIVNHMIEARSSRQSSQTMITMDKNTYYIDANTNQLMSVGQYNGQIGDISAKKLVREQQLLFVLEAHSGDVIVLKGENIIRRYSVNATDLIVIGFVMYYICDANLIRYHLLSDEKEVLLTEVNWIEENNAQLMCQTTDQGIVSISLLEN